MLTLETILKGADLQLGDCQIIRHVFVARHEDTGLPGLRPDSTDQQILEYTSQQSSNPRIFPVSPPRFWVVFIREGGNRARFWRVLDNRGELASQDGLRTFDLSESELLSDLRDRLVIGWRSPRTWRVSGSTAGNYPVTEIADVAPAPFPGFDKLTLSYAELQAVTRENRYSAWRTALASVMGIYLITDTTDGRQYVGKADGQQNILQRWTDYGLNGHGGNVELLTLEPWAFRFSLLRVFDPATPIHEVNAAEAHFKFALDTRKHGLNRN